MSWVLHTYDTRQTVFVASQAHLFHFGNVYIGMPKKTLGMNAISDSRFIWHGSRTNLHVMVYVPF